MGELAGKVALVTGAASGIGRATAEAFAAAGAAVLLADVDADRGRQVVAGIEDAGGRARFEAADVTDPDQVAHLVAVAVDDLGSLDAAVNNAGTSGTYGALPDQTLDGWRATLDLNLTGVFVCLRAEVPVMAERGGGAVVNMASAAGQMGFSHLPAYVASKHGVIGLTRSVALEFAAAGVRVNALCPGTVHTPMLEGFAGSADAARAMGRMAPMGRIGEPAEVAQAALWLCSDAASFVTGHALAVDGGVLAT